MLFMNEFDIIAARHFSCYEADLPTMRAAVDALYSLMYWANTNSDGWHSWPKPARAAKSLMTLIQSVDRYDPQDITEADLRKALAPVKSFLTRQGVDHAGIL